MDDDLSDDLNDVSTGDRSDWGDGGQEDSAASLATTVLAEEAVELLAAKAAAKKGSRKAGAAKKPAAKKPAAKKPAAKKPPATTKTGRLRASAVRVIKPGDS